MEKAAPKVIKPLLKSKIAPDAPGSKAGCGFIGLAGLMKPEEANSKYLSVGGARGFSTSTDIICCVQWLLPGIIRERSM